MKIKLTFILIIILIGISVRIIEYKNIKDNFYLGKTPVLDAKIYDDWARKIINKSKEKKEVYFLNPGYPYFLSVIYRIFGPDKKYVLIVQYISGIISAILIFLITEKYWNVYTAFISACIFAIYRMNLLYESSLLTTTLINFMNLSMVYFVLMNNTIFGLFIAGILFGYSVLLRPNILAFIIFIYFCIEKSHTVEVIKEKIIKYLFFCLGVFMVIFPVSLRNYMVGSEFVLTTSSMGINFYIGNNPDSNGANAPPKFARSNPEELEKDFLLETVRRTQKQMTKGESSDYWLKNSLNFIINEPLKWTNLILKKLNMFFNYFEAGGNFDMYFSKIKINKYFPGFGFLFPLGFIGMIMFFNKFSKLKLFYLYFFYYLVIVTAFFVLSEYRFPIIIILSIFSGAFLFEVFSLINRKKYSIVLIFLLLFSFVFYYVNQKKYEVREEVSVYNMASLFLEEGKYKEAIEGFISATKIDNNYDEAYTNLGLAYSKIGMFQEGIAVLNKAITIRPNNPDNYLNLGLCLSGIGNYDEAIRVTEKAIRSGIDESRALNNIGVIYYKKKDYLNSKKYYELSISKNLQNEEAYNNLGAVYATIGDIKSAIKYFKKALQLKSNYESAKRNLLKAENSIDKVLQ